MKFDIRINKATADGKVKAYASVTFEDCFAVHGVKVVEGTNGLFVSMPNRKNKEDKFVDVAHPVTKEFQQEFSARILEAYSQS